MPDPNSAEAVADELFGAGASGDDVADQLFAPEGSAASPAMQEAVAFQGAPESEPVQNPGVFKEKAVGDEPWYSQLAASVADTPGAAAIENLADSALAHTPDEISAGAIGASPEVYGADRNQGYPGIPAQTPEQVNDYARGSQFEDTRHTLEQEKLGRDAAHPLGAAAGQLAGSALQVAALPEAAATSGIAGLAGAGLTAANYMGQGSGDLSERAGQAAQMAEEHPFSTVASVALPAAAAGAGKLASKGAAGLNDASKINRVAAVMTPGQRKAFADNFGGKKGLIKLGSEIEGANLHKPNPESGWWNNLLPASAENMYDNAAAMRVGAGKRLAAAEDTISTANPPINTQPIVDELRGGANDVLGRSDKSAAGAEAAFRREQAAGLEGNQIQNPGQPGPAPVRPVARPPEGPWTPEQPATYENPTPEELAAYQAKLVPPELPRQQPKEGPWTAEVPEQKVSPEQYSGYLQQVKTLPEGAPIPPSPTDQPFTPARGPGVVEPSAADFRNYRKAAADYQNPGPAPAPKLVSPAVPSQGPGPSVVTPKEWHDYLLVEEQHKNPAPQPSGKTDFKTAVADRRFLDKQTNFTPSGGIENAGMKDQVRRQIGTSLRQNIRSGLDEAAGTNPELAQPVADWNKANKDYSLASTVEDPALMAMQKEYGGNLGLRDMATATAAQAMGLPGPLAMAAGKFAKGGRGANALAGTQKNLSSALGVFGTAAGPSTLATTQAALPDPEVAREKNKSMKEQLADSWDWAKSSFK